eukprot:TRINITY_DN3438_c0_g1_i1.p1 TRINITY_DN3438_c0_g1~~TRINITY_DN3438_c0_g1_i1.p1  ORF type:complete len:205 (-),score=68.55 TRINITY_DN3438_c0_g1_i1:163-777(-)
MFRATFEDKILKSDIVFLRTWYPVEVKQYYNPITDMLIPERGSWSGMKTVYQLRKENSIKIPVNKDSLYTPVERQPRSFSKLQIPKSLMAELPYKSVPKLDKKRKRPEVDSHTAVILDKEDKQRLTTINQLGALKNERLRKQKEKKKEQLLKYLKTKEAKESKKEKISRENRKELYKLQGLMKKQKEEKEGRPKKRRKIDKSKE